MKIEIRNGLPYTTLTNGYNSQSIDISNILIDTGYASTILAADIVADIGILPFENEILYTIRGVGGSEVVFIRETNFINKDNNGFAISGQIIMKDKPLNNGTAMLIQSGELHQNSSLDKGFFSVFQT